MVKQSEREGFIMDKAIPELTLNDGTTIPAIGFGTYALNGNEGVNAINSAIDIGYRLIDTAYNYENEGTVGEAIRRSSVPREQLYITSKLPGRYHEYDKAVTAIQESLYRADLDYYDLYLIHWPNPKQGHYTEAWQALIEAKNGVLFVPLAFATSCLNISNSFNVKQALSQVLTRLNFIPLSIKNTSINGMKNKAFKQNLGVL